MIIDLEIGENIMIEVTDTEFCLNNKMEDVFQKSFLSKIQVISNDIIDLSKQSYLFCSTIYSMSNDILEFRRVITDDANMCVNGDQIGILKKLIEFCNQYKSILSHLTEERWIQPALNWPSEYVTLYVDGLRGIIKESYKSMGILDYKITDSSQITQDCFSDYQHLLFFLETVLEQVGEINLIGIKQQVESRLVEINTILNKDSFKNIHSISSSGRKHSLHFEVPKRIFDHLVRFKSIHIPIDDISIKCQIGSGGFGKVYKATRLSTSELVAVKEIRQDRITHNSWSSLYSEVETMMSLHNENVLELVGAHIHEPFRIITRFCPGLSLFDRIHRKNSFNSLTSSQLTQIAYHIAQGMKYLHSKGIVHRDLKSPNILLDNDNNALVSDFGLSGILRDNQELCGGVGTPNYTAPEVLMHMKYGNKVDVYSYGVMLWEMATRRVPYGEMSQAAIFDHVITHGLRLPFPNNISESLKQLIIRCWSQDPNDRPSFIEIIELFENNAIVFPGADAFSIVLPNRNKCPPLDNEYLLSVIGTPSHNAFASVIRFLTHNIDNSIVDLIRTIDLLKLTSQISANKESVLVLCSLVMKNEELETFLTNDGKKIIEECFYSNQDQSIISSLRFCHKLSSTIVQSCGFDLNSIIALFSNSNSFIVSMLLIFLVKFSDEYLSELSTSLIPYLYKHINAIADQNSLNAVMSLSVSLRNHLDKRFFNQLLAIFRKGFYIKSQFFLSFKDLIEKDDYSPVLYAISLSILHGFESYVFNKFVIEVYDQTPEIFPKLLSIGDFLGIIDNLIKENHVEESLLLLYIIAHFSECILPIAKSSIIGYIPKINHHYDQFVSILSILCSSEDFCSTTLYIDEIIRFLISIMTNESISYLSAKLVCSLSNHRFGSQLLMESSVLDLFIQQFISSISCDYDSYHIVFRNVSKYGVPIPQCPLVVSCLIQEISSDSQSQAKSISTIFFILQNRSNVVHVVDLIHSIFEIIVISNSPLVVYFSLKVICISINNFPQSHSHRLLHVIHSILMNKDMHIPEIIETTLSILYSLSLIYDINAYIRLTQLSRFINEVIGLIPKDSPLVDHFRELEDHFKKID